MIDKIIKLRAKQFYRSCANLGVRNTLFFLTLLILYFVAIFEKTPKNSDGIYLVAFHLFLIFGFHLSRKDKKFLSSIVSSTFRIYFAEYLLLSSPFILMACFFFRFDYAIYQILGVFLIAFFDVSFGFKEQNFNTFLLKLIPAHCFELKSGFRKNFWLCSFFYVLSLIFSFLLASVPLMLLFLAAIFYSFYQKSEPRLFLEACALPPKKFLAHKLTSSIFVFIALHIPLLGLFAIFHSQYFFIILAEFMITLNGLILIIFLKYAMYAPERNLSANAIFIGLALGSIFMPFLIPVISVMSFVYYKKAIQNLTQYLDAYH